MPNFLRLISFPAPVAKAEPPVITDNTPNLLFHGAKLAKAVLVTMMVSGLGVHSECES